MIQWDNYLTQNPYAQRHPLFATAQPIFFKNCDQNSYTNYRKLMQYLDCAVLDIQTVEYNQHLLVCAFMYILIGKEISLFTQNQVLHEFPHSSHYLLDKDNMFNDLFCNFLESTFNSLLVDLLPEIQYCATYMCLPLVNSQPILPNQDVASETMELQEYCSFQTFNKNMYKTIKKRKRGIFA